MKHPAVSREDVIYFVCRFRSLDTSKLDARRRLIDSFVNAVTILTIIFLLHSTTKRARRGLILPILKVRIYNRSGDQEKSLKP